MGWGLSLSLAGREGKEWWGGRVKVEARPTQGQIVKEKNEEELR